MADDKMEKLRNLKADNMLETEKLEQVAGGTEDETSEDGFFLYRLMRRAGMPDMVNIGNPGGYMRATSWTVLRAWEALGVKVIEGDNSTGNRYYIDGRPVSREAAYIHVQKKTNIFI